MYQLVFQIWTLVKTTPAGLLNTVWQISYHPQMLISQSLLPQSASPTQVSPWHSMPSTSWDDRNTSWCYVPTKILKLHQFSPETEIIAAPALCLQRTIARLMTFAVCLSPSKNPTVHWSAPWNLSGWHPVRSGRARQGPMLSTSIHPGLIVRSVTANQTTWNCNQLLGETRSRSN